MRIKQFPLKMSKSIKFLREQVTLRKSMQVTNGCINSPRISSNERSRKYFFFLRFYFFLFLPVGEEDISSILSGFVWLENELNSHETE